VGTGSPNRADALIWALAELFPGLVKSARKKAEDIDPDGPEAALSGYVGSGGWMV
jgi:hypothetical protein